jgi:hypothetical protein
LIHARTGDISPVSIIRCIAIRVAVTAADVWSWAARLLRVCPLPCLDRRVEFPRGVGDLGQERELVDDEAVGDLCFPSVAHQTSFVAALVGHGLATLDLERELITLYDPALFDAPARGPHHPPSSHRHDGEDRSRTRNSTDCRRGDGRRPRHPIRRVGRPGVASRAGPGRNGRRSGVAGAARRPWSEPALGIVLDGSIPLLHADGTERSPRLGRAPERGGEVGRSGPPRSGDVLRVRQRAPLQ